MRLITATIVSGLLLATGIAEAELVRLRVERRETVANGMSFGLAGPYEKLVGMADFALDPDGPRNGIIVDLALAPRNAEGHVEFSAEFFLLKPVDPTRGNGRLFYEAGNRGSKRILVTFQKAARASDPMTPEEFGDGALMRDGFSLLWMGWQWDTPEGRMRMTMPIATEGGDSTTGPTTGPITDPIAGPITGPITGLGARQLHRRRPGPARAARRSRSCGLSGRRPRER